jgi:hypothetical protein
MRTYLLKILGVVIGCALLGFVFIFVWLIGTALSLAIRP